MYKMLYSSIKLLQKKSLEWVAKCKIWNQTIRSRFINQVYTFRTDNKKNQPRSLTQVTWPISRLCFKISYLNFSSIFVVFLAGSLAVLLMMLYCKGCVGDGGMCEQDRVKQASLHGHSVTTHRMTRHGRQDCNRVSKKEAGVTESQNHTRLIRFTIH